MAGPENALTLKGMAWQEEPSAGVEPSICIVGLAGAGVSCCGRAPKACGSNSDSSGPGPIVIEG